MLRTALASVALVAWVAWVPKALCEDAPKEEVPKEEQPKAEDETPKVSILKSPADEKDREGLETWTWSGSDSTHGVETKRAQISEQPGNTVLVADYLGGREGKATVKCLTDLALDTDGKLSVYLYCVDKNPPPVAFAICTGSEYVWQESRQRQLEKGWTKIEIDLSKKEWKSAASEWKYDAKLQDLENVTAIQLLIFNGRNGGLVYVDALQVPRDEKFYKKIDEWVKQLGAEDFEKREQAVKDLVAVGRKALEALRQAAAEAKDPEVAQRAQKAIEQIEGPPATAEAGGAAPERGPRGRGRVAEIQKLKEELQALRQEMAKKGEKVILRERPIEEKKEGGEEAKKEGEQKEVGEKEKKKEE